MLKEYNSKIASVGKKLRHKLLFDIPEEIDYSKVFHNKFLKEQEIAKRINKAINKKQI